MKVRRLFGIFLSVALVSSPLLAVEAPEVKKTTVTRRACADVGFELQAWVQLQAQEPRLRLQFDSLKTAFEAETKEVLTFDKLDNCTVEYPIDEQGKAVEGYRIVIMDKTWYGNQGTDEYKGGIKIVYYVSYADIGSQYEKKTRKTYGFSICKNPTSCNILGIPVPWAPPADPNRPATRSPGPPQVPLTPTPAGRGSDFPV